MSEPKRVNFSAVIVHHIGGEKEAMLRMYFENDGMFVSYEDYARLKAEVERLELEVFAFDRTIKQASCHYDNRLEDIRQLQAQVERLKKAGDAFYESEISYYGEQILNDPKHHSGQMCRDWNAAKEGKPRA